MPSYLRYMLLSALKHYSSIHEFDYWIMFIILHKHLNVANVLSRLFNFWQLIFHGWSDEDCVKILKKCKEAISSKEKGGKVIIVDVVINEKKDEHELTETKLLFDMLMMVVAAGKERSVEEWERLFLEAGFSHYKITSLFGLRSLIEVYP